MRPGPGYLQQPHLPLATPSGPRDALINSLAARIADVRRPHSLRVAIDGVDGAGKTTLADELASVIERLSVSVIRASVDGFHNPQRVRYRRGRDSPEGYYRDSFNYDALVSMLLAPLGPDGSRRFRRAVFEYRKDTPVDVPLEVAAPDAVLLLDGVFLHRPELRTHWDLSLFLDATFDVAMRRAAARGGGSPDPEDAGNRRYVEGQRLYLSECDPISLATVVIDNNDLERPRLMRG